MAFLFDHLVGGSKQRTGCALPHLQVRTALGLPAFHVEDGRGGVAGHRPGFAYSPQQLDARTGLSARQPADDPRRRAFEDYQQRLTEAWKNP